MSLSPAELAVLNPFPEDVEPASLGKLIEVYRSKMGNAQSVADLHYLRSVVFYLQELAIMEGMPETLAVMAAQARTILSRVVVTETESFTRACESKPEPPVEE